MSLTPSAFGTSPKFDAQILKSIQFFHVEFGRLGGGWCEGTMRNLCY
jgi:hypothetical protein